MTKYHRRSRRRTRTFFWYDPAIEQLCYGKFGLQAGSDHKGIHIEDIAEVRVGTDALVFTRNNQPPASEKDSACVSFIASRKTLDIRLPDDAVDLIPGLKLLVDKAIGDDMKKQRGKSSWQKAKFLTRRQGRLTIANMGALKTFKELLVRGLTVRHHVVHRIAIEKQLWLDEKKGRIILASSQSSPAFCQTGIQLIDIAEIRSGKDSFVFANEAYIRNIVKPNMCASIIGSEATLDISFVSATAQDLFVRKFQTLLRLIRPEVVTY